MASIEDLSARFGIKGVATFVNRNGLAAIEVNHPAATGLVYLHGAHVSAWKPAGQQEVLWMSGKSNFVDGKPIRGGVPICFPWFGPKADNPQAPAHGTVRLRAWEVEKVSQDAGGVMVVLATKATDADKALFNAGFELRQRVTFGKTLRMSLELKNTSPNEIRFEEALHTYFSVGDVKTVRVTGLDGVEYLDKVDGAKRKKQSGDITITAETDRPYLHTTTATTLIDPGLKRKIVIDKAGSDATVVWNPWIAKSKAMPDFGDDEWPGMICIETCNVGECALVLAPGASHAMVADIRVEAM